MAVARAGFTAGAKVTNGQSVLAVQRKMPHSTPSLLVLLLLGEAITTTVHFGAGFSSTLRQQTDTSNRETSSCKAIQAIHSGLRRL